MNTTSGTVTVWHSGRLAPQLASRSFHLRFGREEWLGAGLLMLSAVVLAVFIGVLERDVGRNALVHAAQRSRAAAEARCEDALPADQRGRCLTAARAVTVSLAAAR